MTVKSRTRQSVRVDQETPVLIWACMSVDHGRYFEDDVETACTDCGVAIIHRPSAPARAIKVCLACAEQREQAAKEATDA